MSISLFAFTTKKSRRPGRRPGRRTIISQSHVLLDDKQNQEKRNEPIFVFHYTSTTTTVRLIEMENQGSLENVVESIAFLCIQLLNNHMVVVVRDIVTQKEDLKR